MENRGGEVEDYRIGIARVGERYRLGRSAVMWLVLGFCACYLIYRITEKPGWVTALEIVMGSGIGGAIVTTVWRKIRAYTQPVDTKAKALEKEEGI